MSDRLEQIRARRSAVNWSPALGVVPSWQAIEILRVQDKEFIAHAPNDVDALLAEVERLRHVLARLEWPETLPGAGPDGVCPICSNTRDVGHESDCWLAAKLGNTAAEMVDASTVASSPTTVGGREIADRLGVKPTTVAMWKLRGLLPPARWTVSGEDAWDWHQDIEPWAQRTRRLPPLFPPGKTEPETP